MSENKLNENNIAFEYSAMGQPLFFKKGRRDYSECIFPTYWNAIELRVVADYIESNPECRFFNDGSGKDNI